MSLVINTNVSSLQAQNNLSTSLAKQQSAIERLSSGLQINSAADDAAGLAIASRFTAQINGDNQAVNNASDGISLAQTAGSSLTSITNDLQRIRQLAVQSANGTNSASDRAALDTEAQQLKSEIDRQANAASFNGVALLNGSNPSFTFQVGANTSVNDTITVSGLQDARLSGLGSVSSAADTGIVPTSFALAAAGSLVINGHDIGALADVSGHTSPAADRNTQVINAVNAISAQTGVSAALDSTGTKVVLSSASNISITGTDTTGILTGFAVSATPVVTTAAVTTGLTNLSLGSFASSQAAINLVDSALNQINTAQATLGAVQNRFTSVVSNLQSTSQNLTSARSGIQDTNYAAETANLTQANILQQAGTAVLAQANSAQKNVLSLLQNL